MQKIIADLDKLGKEIETSKQYVSKYEGVKEELLSQLKELGIGSLKEAEKELKELKEKQSKLEVEIADEYTLLRQKYDW